MLKQTPITLFLFLFTLTNIKCTTYVRIKQGEIIGKYWTSRNERTFTGFTGIPYAQPPVGRLRFKAPVKLESWNGILNATKYHSACPQPGSYNEVVGNEDCLFLNVYTPNVPCQHYLDLLFSVLFYIHGGSFVYNSASPDWLGPEILLDKDIVLVTINYRLGPLGFLSTGDHLIPGNNGLKDQVLALNWVKENIAQFGGNPNKITIVGNSAGAASLQFLLMSPLSKNLVAGAIMQSGSAVLSSALKSKEESIKNTLKLGKLLSCHSNSMQELVECLQNVDVNKIIKVPSEFLFWSMDSTIPLFLPVVEIDSPTAFITEDPLKLLKTNKVADIPIVLGMVPQEAAYQAAGITTNPEFVKQINENFDTIILREFNINPNNKSFAASLKKFYFNDKEITSTSKTQLTNIFTDGWMLWELDYTVQMHLRYRKSPIYLYLYDYVGSISFVSLYDNSGYHYGVCHTDELFHLLSRNRSFPHYVPTRSDKKVANLMTTLWSNFVHYGNPTPVYNQNITQWNPVLTNNLEHYVINGNQQGMATGYFPSRRQFWQSSLGFF